MVRSRDLGIPFEGTPGPNNAITDVGGVEVGQVTLILEEGARRETAGPVRTGVTVVLPRGRQLDPVFAAWDMLNGAGMMTGTKWVEESGFLESAIALTSTRSVGIVLQAVTNWSVRNLPLWDRPVGDMAWFLPVVAETTDHFLNGWNQVTEEDVFAAIEQARGGPVQEGNAGGGTGMTCFEFKGGVGTSSRQVEIDGEIYTLGVLVQSNFGERQQLVIAGVPVGREISDLMPEWHEQPVAKTDNSAGSGSIIVTLATDAPLLPQQLKRLAKRISLGIARMGGTGNNSSGDIFIAFSTGNPGAGKREGRVAVEFLPNNRLDALFEATAQATEESITNALVAAETMTGINRNIVYALPHDRLVKILRKHNRIIEK